MSLNYFFACYSEDEEVPSTEPIRIDPHQALHVFKQKVKCAEDFIGFIDAQGNILQVVMQENESFWMELPSQAERGSYGVQLNLDEVSARLATLPSVLVRDNFPDFQFKAW